MESMVQDHEKRILALEQNYSEVKKEITAVQTSQSKIENMLYTQNTEQKKMIDNHQKEQKDLLNTLLGHTLGLKKDNHKHKWEVILAACGGGGLITFVLQFLIK